jgi:PH (Pleckstrin Homology) domain-containing protein
MDVFKSKVDKWMLIFLALSMFSCVLGSSVMLKVGGAVNYSIAAFMLIVGAGIPLWILTSTRYIIKNGNLKIVSGPFSWVIPISSITSVQESESSSFSPALSSDRLEIEYGKDKVMIISPDDKTEFMQKLDNERLTSTDTNTQQQAAGKTPKSNTKTQKKHAKKHMRQ